MFQLINSFISGEITDEQCRHCLVAINLGMQYIFISQKSLNHIKLVGVVIFLPMKSKIAKRIDNGSVLESNIQANDILELIKEEYGPSNYGTVKYTHNEIYRIGYIYRYFAITYELTSAQVYKIAKPKELRWLFLPYHTMNPAQAIERILEAKGILTDEEMELERQYNIFKTIRNK